MLSRCPRDTFVAGGSSLVAKCSTRMNTFDCLRRRLLLSAQKHLPPRGTQHQGPQQEDQADRRLVQFHNPIPPLSIHADNPHRLAAAPRIATSATTCKYIPPPVDAATVSGGYLAVQDDRSTGKREQRHQRDSPLGFTGDRLAAVTYAENVQIATTRRTDRRESDPVGLTRRDVE